MKILFLILLFPQVLLAETFNLAWDSVTTDINGNTLNESVTYNIYVSSLPIKDTWPNPILVPVATSTTSSAQVIKSVVGKYYAIVTARNSLGESLPSNEIIFEVKAAVPISPVNLKVIN